MKNNDDITRRAVKAINDLDYEARKPIWELNPALQAVIQRAIDEATAPLLETQRKFGTLQHQLMSRIEELEAALAARGDAEPFGYVHPDGIFRRNKVPPGYERDWTAVYAAPPAKPPGERVLLYRLTDSSRWRQSDLTSPPHLTGVRKYCWATLDSEEA